MHNIFYFYIIFGLLFFIYLNYFIIFLKFLKKNLKANDHFENIHLMFMNFKLIYMDNLSQKSKVASVRTEM